MRIASFWHDQHHCPQCKAYRQSLSPLLSALEMLDMACQQELLILHEGWHVVHHPAAGSLTLILNDNVPSDPVNTVHGRVPWPCMLSCPGLWQRDHPLVNTITTNLGMITCKAMALFHAFTGSDSTMSFKFKVRDPAAGGVSTFFRRPSGPTPISPTQP